MSRVHAALLASLLGGCFQSTTGQPAPPSPSGSSADAIAYRDDLGSHPGCTTAALTYPAADIPGYRCAAKGYAFPSGVSEDTTRPIVLLVHGNSDTPASWERFPESGPAMLAERLAAQGVRTYAIDLRIDRVDDPQANNDTQNAARNIDHGWAVPITEHLITSVLAAHPGRKVSLVGFSLGSTVLRDALRRLHRDGKGVWARVKDVVLLAGAHHGVSSYARLCGKNPTMRGRVACEMGARDGFSPTDFMKALNGPAGRDETPCADGHSAFGDADACAGNHVSYTTVVMRDIADGSYQDEFVSQASSSLTGAENKLIQLSDVDMTGYFFNGLLKNHYGSCRSEAALTQILEALQ